MAERKTTPALLVSTRKGAFILKSDPARRKWTGDAPIMLGHIAHHMVQDPRKPRTLLLSMRTGHLGPTLYRSANRGRTWKEVRVPPAFAKAEGGRKAHVLDHIFWLTPGHASEPGVWYGGASPQGLFRTEDAGHGVPDSERHDFLVRIDFLPRRRRRTCWRWCRM